MMGEEMNVKIIGGKHNLKNRSVGELADKKLMSLYYLLKEAYPKCKGFSAIVEEKDSGEDGVDISMQLGVMGVEGE